MLNDLFNNVDPGFREFPIVWTRTTQLILKNLTTTYQLTQDLFLRDKPIIGLSIRVCDDSERSTIQGNVIAANDVMKNGFLTLVVNNESMPYAIPLEAFLFQYNVASGVQPYRQVNLPKGIIMENCQVVFNTAGGALINDDTAIEFTWHYLDSEQC